MQPHSLPILNRLVLACSAVALATVVIGCGGRSEAPPENSAAAPAPRPAAVAPVVSATAASAEALDGPAWDLARTPFEIAWDLQLPAPVHASWLLPNTPDVVLIQTTNREVHCIDVRSGMTRWVSQRLPRLVLLPPSSTRVLVQEVAGAEQRTDERFYVISGDTLFCFDMGYGQLIYRHVLPLDPVTGFQPSSGPLALGSGENLRVYIGDWEGRIRVATVHAEQNRPYVNWQWNLQAAVTAQPVGSDNLAYVADHGGNLSCFDLDRDRKWVYSAGATLMGSPLIRGPSVYIGTDDNILHSLNRLSGTFRGRVYLGQPIRRRPFSFASEANRLWVWTEADRGRPASLVAIRSQDDTVTYENVLVEGTTESKFLEVERMDVEFTVPNVVHLVGSAPGYLFVMRERSTRVLALDRRTGKIAWHFDLAAERHGGGPLAHVSEYHDGSDLLRSIITADRGGRLVAYRLFGQLN